MAAENANSPISFGLPPSFLPQLEQSKKLAETAAQYWSNLLSFAAKRRQAEAEFVQSLAHCDGVSDLFKRQSEFFQASWTAYSTELPKALGFPAKDPA
ncbi:hypothetical protein [Bradyrhizobium sp. dw_78]|uniref:phasin family protein n=1 Tax=Bradyrhizobium sp. dw_78 TaxID=2719793 RepID=UPI001BD52D95|nr:hypothetical protein [Bradyrhizobium sp. dw_78]